MQSTGITTQFEEIAGLIDQEMYTEALQIVSPYQRQARQDSDTKCLIVWSSVEIMIQWRMGLFRQAYDAVLGLFDAMRGHGIPIWIGSTIVDVLMLFRDWHRALEIIDDLLCQNPQYHPLLFWRASIFLKLKKYAEAQKLLNHLIELNHKDTHAHEALAKCLTKGGQYRQAMRHWEHACEQGSDAAVIEILNLLFVRKGKCDSCGGKAMCCKQMTLISDGAIVCNQWQHERALINDPRDKTWCFSRIDEKGQWIFFCRRLSETGMCSQYDKRSRICRTFPQTVLSTSGIPCAYRFELSRTAPKFENTKVLQVVCRVLSEAGCAIQAALLKEHNK